MARPFAGNWACSVVREALSDDDVTPEEILKILMTQPRAIEVVSKVMEETKGREIVPGGDPAEGIVASLSEALCETGF